MEKMKNTTKTLFSFRRTLRMEDSVKNHIDMLIFRYYSRVYVMYMYT